MQFNAASAPVSFHCPRAMKQSPPKNPSRFNVPNLVILYINGFNVIAEYVGKVCCHTKTLYVERPNTGIQVVNLASIIPANPGLAGFSLISWPLLRREKE